MRFKGNGMWAHNVELNWLGRSEIDDLELLGFREVVGREVLD
jgi:hypothetical protein